MVVGTGGGGKQRGGSARIASRKAVRKYPLVATLAETGASSPTSYLGLSNSPAHPSYLVSVFKLQVHQLSSFCSLASTRHVDFTY